VAELPASAIKRALCRFIGQRHRTGARPAHATGAVADRPAMFLQKPKAALAGHPNAEANLFLL